VADKLFVGSAALVAVIVIERWLPKAQYTSPTR
jgi:hypothetical protein